MRSHLTAWVALIASATQAVSGNFDTVVSDALEKMACPEYAESLSSDEELVDPSEILVAAYLYGIGSALEASPITSLSNSDILVWVSEACACDTSNQSPELALVLERFSEGYPEEPCPTNVKEATAEVLTQISEEFLEMPEEQIPELILKSDIPVETIDTDLICEGYFEAGLDACDERNRIFQDRPNRWEN